MKKRQYQLFQLYNTSLDAPGRESKENLLSLNELEHSLKKITEISQQRFINNSESVENLDRNMETGKFINPDQLKQKIDQKLS